MLKPVRGTAFRALQVLLGQYEKLGPSLVLELTKASRVSGDDLIPMTILVFLSRLHSRSFYMSYLFVLMSENVLLCEGLSGKQQYQLVTLSSAFHYLLSVIKEKTGHGFIEKEKKYQLFFE